MYDIELTGGVKLAMPENLREITVEQYCEFLDGVSDFIGWQNGQLEAGADLLSPAYQLERLHRMAQMVQDFCTVMPGAPTLDQLFSMPVGDYMKSLRETFQIDSLDQLDLEKSEATLYTLWANIYKVVAQAALVSTSGTISFEWKGEMYYLKEAGRDRMSGLEIPPDLTVHEAVEVLELRRKSQSLLDSKKYAAKNIRWELFHRQLAILALREGETLPDDDLAFERFVSDRAANFIGIDAETALKVDFFLAWQFGLLRTTLTAITSSTLRVRKVSRTRKLAVS
jgi:hypothetical protein